MLLKRICWVLLIAFSAQITLLAGPTKEAGKELFTANCASCHAKDMKTNMTGPALGGLEERWSAYPRKDLYAWIRNSQASIAAGQPRAVELWAKYKPVLMNSFTGLTDEQIESLILYINDAAQGGPPPPPGPPTENGSPSSSSSSNLWLFGGIGLILALLAFALMRIVDNLNNVARSSQGLPPVSRTMAQILTTKGAIAFLVFAATLILGYKSVDNATKMGRSQGYEPDQPIKFSHKLHAGTNKIDCQYCHDSARRSKHSSIPGTNTCMNCHAAVKVGSQYGTEELTKIFASIGFDPISNKYIENYDAMNEAQIEELYKKWIGQEYMSKNSLSSLDENGKAIVEKQWQGIVNALKNDSNGKIQGPIEWTRIHNLPDHAYFNHAQHVSVGQVACQKCHGPVEQMEVVYQYSTLGMGWCINCHRETEVKFKENDYYKQYERYHKELTSKSKEGAPVREKVTVEEIGGLECQKCHY